MNRQFKYHVGRSWTGHQLEDDCPCVKAPCGLVAEWAPGCPQHDPQFCKTLRQSHSFEDCPGAPEEEHELGIRVHMDDGGCTATIPSRPGVVGRGDSPASAMLDLAGAMGDVNNEDDPS